VLEPLWASLQEWIESSALSRKKYTMMFRLEQYYWLCRACHTPEPRPAALDTLVRAAEQQFVSTDRAYVGWIVQCQFTRLQSFFDEIMTILETTAKEYVREVKSEHQLTKLCTWMVKNAERGVKQMHERVDKHLCRETALLPVVWRNLSDHFVGKYHGYNKLVEEVREFVTCGVKVWC
jgi:hypothetical protein